MTKYFVCTIWAFDTSEKNDEATIHDDVERMLGMMSLMNDPVSWEEIRVEEVKLEEYKKEI